MLAWAPFSSYQYSFRQNSFTCKSLWLMSVLSKAGYQCQTSWTDGHWARQAALRVGSLPRGVTTSHVGYCERHALGCHSMESLLQSPPVPTAHPAMQLSLATPKGISDVWWCWEVISRCTEKQKGNCFSRPDGILKALGKPALISWLTLLQAGSWTRDLLKSLLAWLVLWSQANNVPAGSVTLREPVSPCAKLRLVTGRNLPLSGGSLTFLAWCELLVSVKSLVPYLWQW